MTRHSIRLDPAHPDDSEYVWLLRCDPRVYEFAGTPEPIGWSTHEAWFNSVLADPGRHLFIASDADQPVGVVRLDSTPDSATTEISILVDPELQGRGLDRLVLGRAVAEACSIGFTTISATVHRENGRSVRLFQDAEFRLEEVFDSQWLHFTWRETQHS